MRKEKEGRIRAKDCKNECWFHSRLESTREEKKRGRQYLEKKKKSIKKVRKRISHLGKIRESFQGKRSEKRHKEKGWGNVPTR